LGVGWHQDWAAELDERVRAGRRQEAPQPVSVDAEMVAFLNARLDEDKERAEKHLCISCGNRTLPLRNAFGITGYTHDGWDPDTETRSGWSGMRCPGRVTGAEPVQNPARELREVAAKRGRLALMIEATAEMDRLLADDTAGKVDQAMAIGRARAATVAVKYDSAVYSDHPDYRPEWAPTA
jgi:hypothetical protein